MSAYWFFKKQWYHWAEASLLLLSSKAFGSLWHGNINELLKLIFSFLYESLQLFIILKKNNSQLSFLHCYHHFFIAVGSYAAARWVPGGHLNALGMINTFVHGIMYFYFFLTALKPELKKSIWWKKHITQIQMVNWINKYENAFSWH